MLYTKYNVDCRGCLEVVHRASTGLPARDCQHGAISARATVNPPVFIKQLYQAASSTACARLRCFSNTLYGRLLAQLRSQLRQLIR